jgi:hypothetical protein
MADNQPHPQPPPGFQRPGIPGAGNILDPEVRGELREQLHDAVRGGATQVAGAAQPAPAGETPPPPAEQAAPAPGTYRAGPFPHGDVDLRGFAANVPPGPVRPQRGGNGRRFYFLPAPPADDAAASVPATAQEPDARKPG